MWRKEMKEALVSKEEIMDILAILALNEKVWRKENMEDAFKRIVKVSNKYNEDSTALRYLGLATGLRMDTMLKPEIDLSEAYEKYGRLLLNAEGYDPERYKEMTDETMTSVMKLDVSDIRI